MAWWHRDAPGHYTIGYRETPGEAGKKRYQTFKRKDDARRFKSEIESKLDRGEYAPVELRKTLLGTYMDLVLGAGDLGEATKGVYGYRRKHITELEGKTVGEITTADIRATLAAMETKGIGAPTRASVRKLLSKVFRAAVNEQILMRNPVSPIPVPRSERREIQVYTSQEIRAIAEAITPRYRAAVLLSAYAGLRAGEISALRVADLDLLRGVITINQGVSLVRGRPVLSTPKTKASRRSVAIPRFVAEALGKHLAESPSGDGLVFHTSSGGLCSSKTLARPFQEASGAIGKPGRWHDLRHTSVALAIEQGAHPKQIQTRLGHTNITTTLDTYGHLFPGLDGALADKMDQEYGQDTDEGRVIAL